MITVESIQKVFDDLDKIFTQKGIIIERNNEGMLYNEQDHQAFKELNENEIHLIKTIHDQIPQLFESLINENAAFSYSRGDFERDCGTNLRAAFEKIKKLSKN